MIEKPKPEKIVTKEIDATTVNSSDEKASTIDHTGVEKGSHTKMECPLSNVKAPDMKSMRIHHDDTHPKTPFDETKTKNHHVSTSSSDCLLLLSSQLCQVYKEYVEEKMAEEEA
uniref:Uncharacterized protein n=1 Tax=Chenopodium quinoa TaxID=63459 RepID=A0A803L467_CHEQI